VNYAKLLEMNFFFTLHSFLEVGKTQDLPSKFWQTLGDALSQPKTINEASKQNILATHGNTNTDWRWWRLTRWESEVARVTRSRALEDPRLGG
jgi:hypothetical protein